MSVLCACNVLLRQRNNKNKESSLFSKNDSLLSLVLVSCCNVSDSSLQLYIIDQ
jgi:high-affinity Fe2+/Pb2+ permease